LFPCDWRLMLQDKWVRKEWKVLAGLECSWSECRILKKITKNEQNSPKSQQNSPQMNKTHHKWTKLTTNEQNSPNANKIEQNSPKNQENSPNIRKTHKKLAKLNKNPIKLTKNEQTRQKWTKLIKNEQNKNWINQTWTKSVKKY